jgi:hypothetical protein
MRIDLPGFVPGPRSGVVAPLGAGVGGLPQTSRPNGSTARVTTGRSAPRDVEPCGQFTGVGAVDRLPRRDQ